MISEKCCKVFGSIKKESYAIEVKKKSREMCAVTNIRNLRLLRRNSC